MPLSPQKTTGLGPWAVEEEEESCLNMKEEGNFI